MSSQIDVNVNVNSSQFNLKFNSISPPINFFFHGFFVPEHNETAFLFLEQEHILNVLMFDDLIPKRKEKNWIADLSVIYLFKNSNE